MDVKMLIIIVLLGSCTCTSYSAAWCPGPCGQEAKLQEEQKLRRLEYEWELSIAQASGDFRRVVRLEQIQYAREKAKRACESKIRQRKERGFYGTVIHQRTFRKNELERERVAMAHMASSKILLNNANVPIEQVELTERENVVLRIGNPRSPSENLLDQSLWEIPVDLGHWPFILSIKAHNRIYRWRIISVGSCYGNEFALIQKIVPGGFKLELKQIEEVYDSIEGTMIPLSGIVLLPKKVKT